ncbi:GAF domain-containing protein [Natronospora cellulosivora (SeqCode)]
MLNYYSNWESINKKFKALVANENNMIANMANASALLYSELDQINWAGFYIYQEKELILGPFQGLPACVRIPLGRGVCGKAAYDKKVYLVPDVREFPDHIACDQASRSEIVLPIIVDKRLIGVLDIDSPIKARFGNKDKKNLEKFLNILLKNTKF